MTKTTLVTLGISSLLACNLSGKIDAAIDQLDIFCTPGEEIECACEDGENGSQTCQVQGTSFSDCLCENSSALTACTPGEMDACVCEGTEDLGARTCLGNKEWDACFCEDESMETGLEESIPFTEWVLRDKNEDAVSAIFEPSCGVSGSACWFNLDFPCVLIEYFQGALVKTTYDLTTGDSLACYSNNTDWKALSTRYGFYFDNPDCDGVPFLGEYEYIGYTTDGKIKFNNELYYVNPKTPAAFGEHWYVYLDGFEICEEASESIYAQKSRRLEKVPSNVLALMVDRAPYAIQLE